MFAYRQCAKGKNVFLPASHPATEQSHFFHFLDFAVLFSSPIKKTKGGSTHKVTTSTPRIEPS